MHYLSVETIALLHARVIDQTGGSDGLRDADLLLHLAEKPRAAFGGSDVYADLFDKAAALLQGLARGHVFTDGNKRTGLVVAARILAINGYELSPTNHEAERFTLRVVTDRLEVPVIAAWLRQQAVHR